MELRKANIAYIKNISFLKRLPDKVVMEIISASVIRNYGKDEIIFLESEQANKFYIVLNGYVKIFNETINGNESIISLLNAGQYFGEKSLMENSFYSSSAGSIKNSQLLEIPSRVLINEMNNNNEVSKIILQELLQLFLTLENLIENLVAMDASQRIGWYIINNIIGMNNKLPNKYLLQHDKSIIATFLGMKPETFSRAIKKLQKVDVYIKGTEIVVKDLNSLYAYCNKKAHNTIGKEEKFKNRA